MTVGLQTPLRSQLSKLLVHSQGALRLRAYVHSGGQDGMTPEQNHG